MTRRTGVADGRVLCVRLDSMGDVLLAGPAVRAVAATASSVTMLVSSIGAAAARLLPDVDAVEVFDAPWTGFAPPDLDAAEIDELVDMLRRNRFDAAVIFTSFHQSALPMALLARMAGIEWVGAMSVDYPGSLLDLRCAETGDIAESERMMTLAQACGGIPDARGSALSVAIPDAADGRAAGPHTVAVHPGASVPAREPSRSHTTAIVAALVTAGFDVVVTAAPDDAEVAARIAADAGARAHVTAALADLAALLARCAVVVSPNTGPAHLAAAVGTPVVSLFAPVVPAARWAPHGVPTVILGDQSAPCRNTRARTCPLAGHPCLNTIAPRAVVDAVTHLWPTAGSALAAGSPAARLSASHLTA